AGGIDHIVCGEQRNIGLNVSLKKASGFPAGPAASGNIVRPRPSICRMPAAHRGPLRRRPGALCDVIKARTLAPPAPRPFRTVKTARAERGWTRRAAPVSGLICLRILPMNIEFAREQM